MRKRQISARKISAAIVEDLELRRLCSVDNYYFKATSSTVIGEWINTTHQGTGTPTTTLSTSGSGGISGFAGGVMATFDETGPGQAIQTGGFSVTGNSSYTSTNSTWIIGTSGNDTFSSSSSAMKFGSTTVSISNMAFEYINPNGGTDSLTTTGGTTVLTAGAVGGGIVTRGFSNLNISSGAEVYVQAPASNHSDRQVIDAASSGFLINGTLDLTSNDAIVTSGNWGGINGSVAAGYTKTSVSTVTTSVGSAATTVGVMPNNGGSGTTAIYSTFDGISVSYKDILLKWTYFADANDSGFVDSADKTLLDHGSTNSLSGWYNGDFNYDGVINGSDYTLYDNLLADEGTTHL